MNELKIKNETKIEDIIYEIRNMKVILDSDVAKICNIKTKVLNQTIKRNIDKFSNIDYFKLNDADYQVLRSQIVTSNITEGSGGRRYNPYVFSESGIKKLATILKNKDELNDIINAFNMNKLESNLHDNSNKINNLIYENRGKQVMLDYDLATLYKTETKRINEAVKNNIEKFPNRFSWVLTDEESDIFLVENFDQKTETRGGRYKNPRVFTEQGVVMLATILKTKVAIETSIKIVDAFVSMRRYFSNNLIEQKNINNLLIRHEEDIRKNTEDIKIIQETLSRFDSKKIVNEIYFNGQIFDAYSKIVDIFNTTKKELIIIDGYADKTVLDMIKNLKCDVILIIKNKGNLSALDISKYNSQYTNLKVVYNDDFHDRYFILDKSIIYHCGTSINHAGSKTFSINIIEDKIIKQALINNIKTII